MTNKKVWFITGAGRGMGVHIAKAALAAGSVVVATGRNTDTVIKAVGEADDLLVVKLDVTSPEDAAAAVTASVDRFGGIDVLVNNAGNFYAGFFEEITPQDFRAQVETLLFGPINVTRAVLPVMRAQRSGLVVTISSTAGIRGGEFLTAYAASKFGVEGWMESLTFMGFSMQTNDYRKSPPFLVRVTCDYKWHQELRSTAYAQSDALLPLCQPGAQRFLCSALYTVPEALASATVVAEAA